mmetsp:Transcript_12448/g.37009  ORF Transcript_12448/g.37009 Transcript_12448/m.37009 type:complete len:123 (+) Transcript_12448:1641-2009(+)
MVFNDDIGVVVNIMLPGYAIISTHREPPTETCCYKCFSVYDARRGYIIDNPIMVVFLINGPFELRNLFSIQFDLTQNLAILVHSHGKRVPTSLHLIRLVMLHIITESFQSGHHLGIRPNSLL